MKLLKDYLHLYLGCDVDTSGWMNGGIAKIRILTYVDKERNVAGIGFYYPDYINCEQSQLLELPIKDIKPVLRRLSDMTEEERTEYNRKGFYDDITRSDAERTYYLLSKHFDLFGLIEAGLAIDKTTISEIPNL